MIPDNVGLSSEGCASSDVTLGALAGMFALSDGIAWSEVKGVLLVLEVLCKLLHVSLCLQFQPLASGLVAKGGSIHSVSK